MTPRGCAIFLLLLCACADNRPGPTPVDTQTFGRIIADLELAEAASAEVPVMLRDSISTLYYDSVLADHGYTRAEFDSIMWIIRSEPEWIDSVYTRAGEIVSREMINLPE